MNFTFSLELFLYISSTLFAYKHIITYMYYRYRRKKMEIAQSQAEEVSVLGVHKKESFRCLLLK